MSNCVGAHLLFSLYFKTVQRRRVDLSDLEVFVATSLVYGALETEREENNWCVEELLKFLVSAMDYSSKEINPNMFLVFKSAYLDRLKKYYIENKNV